MSPRRFALTVLTVFILSQVFAIVIHGFILGPDYRPFYGTLLRPMGGGDPKAAWPALFLPLAHLAMAIAFVALFGRWVRPGGDAIAQGLTFGVLAWHWAGSDVSTVVRRAAVAAESHNQTARPRALHDARPRHVHRHALSSCK